jgi:phage terminase large subunit
MPKIVIPKAFEFLKEPKRYKVPYGGRGGAKSHNIARTLLVMGVERPLRVVCAREIQKSIKDSVHALLKDIIREYELSAYYEVQDQVIKSRVYEDMGFSFRGLKHNTVDLKSLEAVDILWIEEAENVSDGSYEIIIPTIRKENSEIWISFNPKFPTDATYQRFVATQDEDIIAKKVSWREKERLRLLRNDPVAYEHVWEGNFDTRYSGCIYAKWVAERQTEGCVLPNLYDPTLPVYTAWDLGYDDATSIWFYQVVHGEIRLIEYYENYGQDVPFYASLLLGTNTEASLKNKYTNYAGHAVPHDAANKLLAAGGRSIYQQLVTGGLKNIRIVPATSQKNSIEATRAVLKLCWFDADNTKDGQNCLMQYCFEYDEDRKIFKSTPKHDWASHGSDALEIIGQVWKELTVPASKPKTRWANEMTFNELMALARKKED